MPLPLASLTDFLSHPAWTAAATLLAVVAIITTIALYSRGRSRKDLTFTLSETPLVSVRSEAKEKVEILYGGTRVRGVHLVSFSVSNTGNVPVLSEDFEGPVLVGLGLRAVPLPPTLEITKQLPTGLNPSVKAEPSRLVLDPLLLNPGDSFAVSVLVRDFDGPLSLSGHTAGVNRIGVTSQRADTPRIGRLFGLRTRHIGLEWATVLIGAVAIGSVATVPLALAATNTRSSRCKMARSSVARFSVWTLAASL